MRICFDENTPRVVAHAVKLIAEAEAKGDREPLEVVHALDVVNRGTADVPLIQAIAGSAPGSAALVTSDRTMRTRHHERAAFHDTGCIGIVLRGGWNHASLWDRAILTLSWWTVWMETVRHAEPGSLWQCPWTKRVRPLRPF